MSTMQRLTLIGLFNYDSSLFDNLTLPDGYDKDTFIESLLLEHGEKCVLYSDFDFMRYSIGVWSRKWALELSRIYEALTAEYNPIYNYDRHEEIGDTENRKYESVSDSEHTATDKPNYDTIQEQNVDSESEDLISADNSDNYQPERKNIQNAGKTTTTIAGTSQNLDEKSNNKVNDSEDRTLNHTAHIFGNVGVTTSASMVTEVIEQRMKYNLYEAGARLFANELLIGIY